LIHCFFIIADSYIVLASDLLLLPALALLALHHDQQELVVRRHQDLVFGGFEPHELELVVRI